MSTATPVSRASFIIYTDESTTVTSKPVKSPLPIPAPSPALPPSSSRIVVATASDKENVDPLTGQLPSIEDQLAKKRKTNVLIAKLVVTAKPQPDQKKRKVLSAASASTNTISRSRGEKKEKKALGAKKSRNTSSSRVRELPKVEEEEDGEAVEIVSVANVKSAAQAHANSRCYELTVMPLADVSEAYSPTHTLDDELVAAGEKLKAATISKEASVVKSARAPSPAPDPAPAARSSILEASESKVASPESVSPSSSPRSSTDIPAFSTPERKRIYSAFTFSSPSPAGERYAVTRANNPDRFSDLAFNLGRTL